MATNRAPGTVHRYLVDVEILADFLDAESLPTRAAEITRAHLEQWLVYLASKPSRRGGTLSAATVARTYRSVQQFFRWLVDEEEIATDPFAKMRPPAIPEQPVPIITDAELRRLLDACKGNTFEARRDNAILRVLLDTGIRASELAGIELDDLDFELDVVRVMGKGRRGRAAPFGVKTGDALRRYLRSRAQHPHAAVSALWLGVRGPMTPSGISQMIGRRGTDAGIDGLHPHRFRHTFAHRWLAAGNQEQDLMRLTGWRSREMVGRYAASAADQRAREAHRRAGLGDDL
ncbi:Site-specific recombinase XerD [Pseudonocardia ammonioxydans]|uniref:Site-specific recombinase XerD n=2 Tax=Pseudonocardia ammonioxydans TaxID=260086 RepID=A0A1I5HWG7_PSUAM|nr:Site-specific recombinase XerD [Pseudonocardia ammonioxydans]